MRTTVPFADHTAAKPARRALPGLLPSRNKPPPPTHPACVAFQLGTRHSCIILASKYLIQPIFILAIAAFSARFCQVLLSSGAPRGNAARTTRSSPRLVIVTRSSARAVNNTVPDPSNRKGPATTRFIIWAHLNDFPIRGTLPNKIWPPDPLYANYWSWYCQTKKLV